MTLTLYPGSDTPGHTTPFRRGTVYREAPRAGRVPKWVAAWRDGGRRRYKRFPVRDQAVDHLRTVFNLWGVADDAATMKATDWLRRWLAETKGTVAPGTWARYDSVCRLHLAPALGSLRLKALAPKHCQSIVDTAEAKGMTPRGLHHLRAILSNSLNRAVERGYLTRNPVRGRAVALPKASRTVPDLWTLAQCDAFLAALPGARWAALYTVAATTGLRQSELLGLEWSRVDLERGEVRVWRTSRGDPKTARSARVVPLPPQARAALLPLRKQTGAVFPGIEPARLREDFKRLQRKLGLPVIRYHDLRSLYAVRLAMANIPVKVAQDLLGHVSPVTTLALYARVSRPDVRAAVEGLWGQCSNSNAARNSSAAVWS